MKSSLLIALVLTVSALGQSPAPYSTPSAMLQVKPRWQASFNKDPVFQFAQRVDERARKDPIWETDYRAAHYKAFVAETQQYAIALLKKKGLIKPEK